MTPKTLHLVLLGILCLGPLIGGVSLALKGLDSHADTGGLVVAAGAGLLLAALGYALITSLLVWKFGQSWQRVLAVHGAGLGVIAAFGLATRVGR